MALTKCRECKTEISTDAKTCPKCGAKRPSGMRFSALAGLILGAAFLSSLFTGGDPASSSSTPPAATTSPSQQITAAQPAPTTEVPTSFWMYEDQTDKLTGKSAHYASITSSNKLVFDWPYSSPNNRGYLTVRRHPVHGTDAYLSIDKGHMICHYNDCKITVRFDDGPARTYEGASPEDHSTTIIFFREASRFIAAAKTAKMIRVQFTAYQAGGQVLEFGPTDALRWP